MMDLRSMLNDRTYLSTFISGNRYVNVVHRNKVFTEVLEGIEEQLGIELVKPFVIVSSALLYREEAQSLVERELVDVDLLG